MGCHSPVRSGGVLVSVESLSVLELLAACSRCGLSTEGDLLVLRRRLAEYQAHPSPSCPASCEEDDSRWWLGTAGAGWLRVPFSFVVGLPPLVVQHFLESRGFPRAVIELSVRDYFLDVAQEVWEELMVPVSGSFSPGPVEYFALLVRTSLSVLLGLSRTVQALFKESVCDGLPTGTTVTMFLRHCVAADMVDYVVQSHGSSGCVVRRTDGKVTRDFPAHGLVVPGAVVLARLAVAARLGALGNRLLLFLHQRFHCLLLRAFFRAVTWGVSLRSRRRSRRFLPPSRYPWCQGLRIGWQVTCRWLCSWMIAQSATRTRRNITHVRLVTCCSMTGCGCAVLIQRRRSI